MFIGVIVRYDCLLGISVIFLEEYKLKMNSNEKQVGVDWLPIHRALLAAFAFSASAKYLPAMPGPLRTLARLHAYRQVSDCILL